MRIEKLIETTNKIRDPRRSYGNLRHKLSDILVIGLCTMMCKGEDFTDMEDFGKEREEWLKGFLELPNGIPDSDTFRRVFERIDPAELSNALYGWLGTERKKRDVVTIDGKTICGSGNGEHKAYHVVSAFVAENQTSLHDDVKLYFENLPAKKTAITKEKGHGRIEKREYFLETDIDWLPQKADWVRLQAIGAVKSTVFEKEETRIETRYFITSLNDVNKFADAVRKHWSVESQLHWHLDVTFGEDNCRARKDNSPLNLNVLRKTALALLKEVDWGRIGLKKKMFIAALNPDKLLHVLFSEK